MRSTTVAIGLCTFALALGDWFEGTLDAEMAFDVEPAPPAVAAPDLGQEAGVPATLGDVTLAVAERPRGCTISAVSTGKDDQDLDLRVEVWETSGSEMARMVPPPRKVTEQAIRMHVPAGRRVTRAVTFEGLADAAARPGAFRSREFRLVQPGADVFNRPGAGSLASLRVPVQPVPAAMARNLVREEVVFDDYE